MQRQLQQWCSPDIHWRQVFRTWGVVGRAAVLWAKPCSRATATSVTWRSRVPDWLKLLAEAPLLLQSWWVALLCCITVQWLFVIKYLFGFAYLYIYLFNLCHQRAPKSRPMATISQVQCRRSGCKNVSPGCTDLCPDCLNRGGQREGRRAHAPKEKSKQRCRTQGCDHYANQEKQGYCNECDHFKQIYRGWRYQFPFPKRGLEIFARWCAQILS